MLLNFSILGFIFIVGIWVLERREWRRLIRFSLVAFTSMIFIIAAYILSDRVFLDHKPWYDMSPFRDIILFMIMLFGMVARTLSRAIEKRNKKVKLLEKENVDFTKPKIELDLWDFTYPVLFSFVTFGVLLSQIEQQVMGLMSIILAFQNGFFWKTVLKS